MAEIIVEIDTDLIEQYMDDNEMFSYYDPQSGIYDGAANDLIRAAFHSAVIKYNDEPVKPVLRIV